MLKVFKERCLGCGLCAENCFQGAISMLSGQAEIDASRCNHCQLCIKICPQGAIMELVPLSRKGLKISISELQSQTDSILERIDRLREKRRH